MQRIVERLADQAGVISRRQLHAAGCAPHDIERMVRRRDLSPRSPGVFLSHTGEPTWLERAWIALLHVSSDVDLRDVALSHESALRIVEGPGRRDAADGPIHVAIPEWRRVRSRTDLIVHRIAEFARQRHPSKMPPRIRYEEAVLDVAAQLGELDALEILTRAVGGRYSSAPRLLTASELRSRVRRRRWLEAVLADIDRGTHSVLEQEFLERVVRAHGLPNPALQRREVTSIGVVYRDAVLGGVIVELDGRLHHSQLRHRAADMQRDLEVAAAGVRTVRLGWGQVVGWPCQTAAALARLAGCSPRRRCGSACVVVDSGSLDVPGTTRIPPSPAPGAPSRANRQTTTP